MDSPLRASLVDTNGSGYGYTYSTYSLSGSLKDGTLLNKTPLYIQNGTGAKFVIINSVPEPSSIASLVGTITFGASVFRKRCNRR